MSVFLKNITQSYVNIPDNAGSKPRIEHTLPDSVTEVTDEYLKSLDKDAYDRFVRVCSEPEPLFKVYETKEALEKPEPVKSEKKSKKLKLEPAPEPEPSTVETET